MSVYLGHSRFEVNKSEKSDKIALTLKAPRKPASENVVCLCHLLNILANFSNLFLHIGKQCGPRSDCSQQGSNLQPPNHQSDMHPTEPLRLAYQLWKPTFPFLKHCLHSFGLFFIQKLVHLEGIAAFFNPLIFELGYIWETVESTTKVGFPPFVITIIVSSCKICKIIGGNS